jgi:hypothetical protein
MSTIHPENEPRKESALIYPMWWVVVYEREAHTNGESYYVRAPSRATGIIRALALHPDDRPFEKISIEEATSFMDCEAGYGLET